MRRLPVYFLIDISESMVGEPIAEVEKGIRQIIGELLSDPYALETVYVGVDVFAGQSKKLAQLTELTQFEPPAFPIGSGTSLGKGLEMLMSDLDRDIVKTSRERKGDWKPIIFLFTDGAPTDNPRDAIKKWNDKYKKSCNLVTVTFGNHADIRLLESFSDTVLTLTNLGQDSFREFFKWVTASIKVSSMAVAENAGDGFRAGKSCINLEKADASKCVLDENFVIIPACCSKKKDTFLLKFGRSQNEDGIFEPVGAYPVDGETYRSLGGGESGQSVESSRLSDIPPCPICGNTGYVLCNCGQFICYDGSGKVVCPACGKGGTVGEAESLNLARGRG